MTDSALLTLSGLLPHGRPDAMHRAFVLIDPLGYSGRGFINSISQVGRLRLVEAKYLPGGRCHTTCNRKKEEGSPPSQGT